MIQLNDLAEAFARNVTIVGWQTDGLTHADSMKQLPFQGNCMNWVVGHMAAYRDIILDLLGEASVMGDDGERYQTDSDPLKGDDAAVLPLETLLERLDQSQQRLAAALGRMDEADMAREITVWERKTTVGQRLFFMYFHESYHVGQTELLRQLAGKNDKII